ncbi:hypothetical protein BDA96_08G094400 [Sorghum bicolor]|uniref:Uncharacterized protein n=1 Tax=Sorghum bicolor TaxID=4558 RepID=A0A921U713_SORBI|nr:hypothetical protein BDA96_08G094400 [Sorghum bicolor]
MGAAITSIIGAAIIARPPPFLHRPTVVKQTSTVRASVTVSQVGSHPCSCYRVVHTNPQDTTEGANEIPSM